MQAVVISDDALLSLHGLSMTNEKWKMENESGRYSLSVLTKVTKRRYFTPLLAATQTGQYAVRYNSKLC